MDNLILVCPNCHRIIHTSNKYSKEFLQEHSMEKDFYNWRDFSEKNVETIKYYLNWPINGMKFDIANGFWLECFGERTDDMEQNQIKAEEYMRNSKEEEVPRLMEDLVIMYASINLYHIFFGLF